MTTVIIGVAILFVSAAIYAKSVPDVIPLNDPAYKEHKKGVVQFEHKKHWDEYSKAYPEFYPSQCGECHHDDKGKPLTKLKDGDDVQKCIECHKKPGEVPKELKKEWKAKKVKKKEKDKMAREWHAEAIHDNCRACHKAHNKKTKTKDAPTTCAQCHPKEK